MVMDNRGGCLPDPPHHMHIPMSAPSCLYWANNDHSFQDDGAAIGVDGSTRLNNLCGSVDLMTDVLLHSSLLQDSQAMTINPIVTTGDAAAILPAGAAAAAATSDSPDLSTEPAGSASLDLPCIPGPLQDALWWMMSPADLIVNNALVAPAADHNNTTSNMAPTTSGAAVPSNMTAHHHLDDVPVGSASRYLGACKDEVGGALLASAILSHCAGNTNTGAVDDNSVGMWRSLMATCCTSGNAPAAAAAASSVDSEESEMYGNAAGGTSPYANSCAQQGNDAVVDIRFLQHATSCSPTAHLVNDPAAAIISSTTSHYNLGPQQQPSLPGNANRVACSDSSAGQEPGGAALLQYSGNTSASTAAPGASFSIDFENPNSTTTSKPPKRPRSADRALMMSSSSASRRPSTPSIDFRCADVTSSYEPDPETVAHVKEMIYRAAAFRPVNLGAEEAVERPRRKNVRISSDPQTVAARHRRERISERLRVLQRLVPGGSKMDTASMLDEAANYLKFLKSQVSALEGGGNRSAAATLGFKNGIMNAAAATPTSTGSCGGIPLLPSSILAATSSSLSNLDHGFDIPAQGTPKTIPSQLRDHSIELGNRALH